MSILAQHFIWDNAHALSDRALIVGLKIADHHNSGTGQCNPSIDTLIDGTGRSKSTVIRAIKELETCDGITVERKKNRNNRYSFRGCKVWAVGANGDTHVGVNGDT